MSIKLLSSLMLVSLFALAGCDNAPESTSSEPATTASEPAAAAATEEEGIGEKMGKALDDATAGMKEKAGEVSEQAGAMMDSAKEKAGAAMDSASEMTSNAVEEMKSATEKAIEEAGKALESADNQVEETTDKAAETTSQ